jgi:ABC-2 type transport system ATP-binding protein
MKVRIQDLVKSYRGKRALDGISFSVREGEIFGFIGPNGAGKTTTLSILAGLIGFDSGTCEVDGMPPRSRGGIGYLPEQPVFSDSLTGREYLAMLATTMAIPRAAAETDRLLERVSLSDAADRRIAGYSRGMRQRLALACALLGSPTVLLLDEPSSALDPEGRKAVVDLILGLKAEGRTVLLSTHILSDIERVCDRIALIDSGTILVEGAVDELLGEGLTGRIDLFFSRPLEPVELARLHSLPPVESIQGGNGGSSLTVVARGSDLPGARMALVRTIADLALPLVSFAPRRMSLEDLFLEKVARHA